MKKVLKYIGLIVVLILLIGVVGVSYINFTGIPQYPVNLPDYEVKSSPEAIKRGEKLAMLLCATCHLNQESRKLTGQRMMDAPPEFGVIYSQNITNDSKYGIGDWSDAEILHLLRTGIKRDGSYAPPYMAKLPKMSDDDLNAIIAFLRSNSFETVSNNVPDTACEPTLLTKLLCRVAFKPFPMPAEKILDPDTTNKVEWGKYLAINFECFSCHSADFKTNDFFKAEKSVGYFGGGNKPLNREGHVMLTPNLTPDNETGIGSWSEERFIKAVRFGESQDGIALRFPMNPYSRLTNLEASAIYAYLKTIPAIKNKVERSK